MEALYGEFTEEEIERTEREAQAELEKEETDKTIEAFTMRNRESWVLDLKMLALFLLEGA